MHSSSMHVTCAWWPSSAIGQMSICTIFLYLFIFFNLIAILFIFYFCFVTNGFISILFLVQNKFTVFSSALFLCQFGLFYFCFVLLTNGFISILFLVQNKFTFIFFGFISLSVWFQNKTKLHP